MEHGPLRRGKYKKYLRDLNAPIPRTTKWRMMRRNADATLVRGSSLAAPLIAGTCSEGTSAHHACICSYIASYMYVHHAAACMGSSLFQYTRCGHPRERIPLVTCRLVDRIRKWEYTFITRLKHRSLTLLIAIRAQLYLSIV